KVSAASFARDEHGAVLSLRGDFDMSTDMLLSAAIFDAVTSADEDLVLDLHGVRFMSASTLGVIVRTRTLLTRQSRFLRLRSPSRSVQRILDICAIECLDPVAAIDDAATIESHGALQTWVPVLPVDPVSPPTRTPTMDDAEILAIRPRVPDADGS
ncbi:MAG: STAS domain-containing protein, partial [Acidimicrobiales bacterium]